MDKTKILPVVEDILSGRCSVENGAERLQIGVEEVNSYIRLYSIYGRSAITPSFYDRIFSHLNEQFHEYKLLFSSHFSMQKLKLKLAYSLLSFSIVSIGIVMFTFSASIFPKFMFASERNGDFSKARLISNMEFKNRKSVDRQLKKADSIYARMAKILKEDRSSSNSELMKIIKQRRENINKIRLDYIKNGKRIKKNLALKYKDGEIYERMLDALPQYEIKNNTEFARVILQKVQTSSQKLAAIKKFYRSSLRKSRGHYSKIIKRLEKIETEKVVAEKKKKKLSPKKELSRLLLQKLYEDIRNRNLNHRRDISRYARGSKMAVISRYNRENQILRTLSCENYTRLQLKI